MPLLRLVQRGDGLFGSLSGQLRRGEEIELLAQDRAHREQLIGLYTTLAPVLR